MIVFFVLQNAYAPTEGRLNFILQTMSVAKQHDSLIIVNEYFKEHFQMLIEGTLERFYDEFEMEHLTREEVRNITFCFVPDKYFDAVREVAGSRTKMLVNLCETENESFTEFLIESIDLELKKRGEKKPELFMCCIETMASMRTVAKHYVTPMVPYLFSPIKKIHGYAVTLYNAHIGSRILSTDTAAIGLSHFQPEKLGFPLLTNKELLALLGKRRNICLLPLVDGMGKWEVGIAAQSDSIIPQTFVHDWVTDEDVYFDAERLFGADCIQTRLHPNKMIRIGLGKKHYKNDPAAFILSSKRMAMVQSQMSLKSALWNRSVCVYADALPYSFAFSHSLETAHTVPLNVLNYVIFGYLVPSHLLFDMNYWKWRMTGPSSNDIFLRHLYFILDELGIDRDMLHASNRFNEILKCRDYSDYEISLATRTVDESEVNYKFLASRVSYEIGHEKKLLYCLNRTVDGGIISCFNIPLTGGVDIVCFYPLDDVDGFVRIITVTVNGRHIDNDQEEMYLDKGRAAVTVHVGQAGVTEAQIEIYWSGMLIFDKY